MIKILIAVLFWSFLSWLALRFLGRAGKLTRPQNPNAVPGKSNDPIDKAKKADVIDLK